MTPRTMRALADLVDALRAEAAAQEQRPAEPGRFKVAAVAAVLDVSHNWLLELIARGQVKATRYGREYRIDGAEVERLKAEGVPQRAHRRRVQREPEMAGGGW